MSGPTPKHLAPVDEARLDVISKALACVGALHASDEEVQAVDDALDLAVLRHASELLAEREEKS